MKTDLRNKFRYGIWELRYGILGYDIFTVITERLNAKKINALDIRTNRIAIRKMRKIVNEVSRMRKKLKK